MRTRRTWVVALGPALAAALGAAGGCELIADFGNPRLGNPCITPGETQPCYTGPPGTEDRGTCRGGTETCTDAGAWGACTGEVTPEPRSCASTEDVACLGKDNCAQWAELFGSLAGAQAISVGVDGKGNVFVAGLFNGTLALPNLPPLTAQAMGDMFLLELDPTGRPLWGKSFTGGVPSAGSGLGMAVDAAGYVVLSGACLGGPYSFDGMPAGPGFWVAKLDGSTATGTVEWAKTLSVASASCASGNGAGSGCALLSAVALTPQGDVVVGGTFSQSSVDFGDGPIATAGIASFVAQLRGSDGSGKKADGNWNQILCNDPMGTCLVTGVAVDGMGNVLIAGGLAAATVTLGPGSFLTAGKNASNAFLGKLASNGGPIWQRQIGDPNNANVGAVAMGIDGAGGPILVGVFNGDVDFGGPAPLMGPDGGTPYQFIAHYGPDDAYAFALPLQNASIHGVAGDTANNVLLAGSFTGPLDLGGPSPLMGSGPGNTDVLAAKLSGAGKLLWAKGYGYAKPPSDDEAEAIALTSQGAPVIVGYTTSPINFGLGVLTPATATVGGSDAFVAELSSP
jgi:hypothetical protein